MPVRRMPAPRSWPALSLALIVGLLEWSALWRSNLREALRLRRSGSSTIRRA